MSTAYVCSNIDDIELCINTYVYNRPNHASRLHDTSTRINLGTRYTIAVVNLRSAIYRAGQRRCIHDNSTRITMVLY